jgi:2-polyprenyl-3-methyl-5-hydroxy-6-metoxy-1,4-benzoquinol methylase
MKNRHYCHICGSDAVKVFDNYRQLKKVTSDIRIWEENVDLCFCTDCSTIQKKVDLQWRMQVADIYKKYMPYSLSSGEEQRVFCEDGSSKSRSNKILEWITSLNLLDNQGRLLDVGYGNGALLKAFSNKLPHWELVGTELSDQNKEVVEKIPGVETVFQCEPENVPGQYNIISMIHILEHIENPIPFLKKLKTKLEYNGKLLIEVPNYKKNAFDLIVYDHCTHFSVDTITWVLDQAGYRVLNVSTSAVQKEITIVCESKKEVEAQDTNKVENTENDYLAAQSSIAWLQNLKSDIRQKRNCKLGIFGTSIAGTWLHSELLDEISFFVDEDEDRIGKTYMNKTVLRPSEVRKGEYIVIPMPHEIAKQIASRLQHTNGVYFTPSPISENN